MTNQEILATINALLKTSDEGERVFRFAAENVQSSNLAVIIACLGDNCQQRTRELHNHLVQLGGHTSAGSHRWVAVHCAWLALRSKFCFNVDLEMLRYSLYREDQAIYQYRQALDKPLPGPLHVLLKRHYLGARCNSARISDLIFLEQTIAPRRHRQNTLSAGRPLRTGHEFDI